MPDTLNGMRSLKKGMKSLFILILIISTVTSVCEAQSQVQAQVQVQAQAQRLLPEQPETVYLRYSPVTLPGMDYGYGSSFDVNGAYSGYSGNTTGGGLFNTISSQPGYAFLASAVVPGLGQAANRQWWKTALFVTVEAAAIGLYIHNENRARSVERQFWRLADGNWSVVQYASWLVDYYNAQNPSNPFNPDNLLNPGYQGHGIPSPAFNNDIDWQVINLSALRQLERSTLYLTTGNPFSHDLPDYGSQQYYELISKYWQYGPGWIDWNPAIHDINLGNSGMPGLWLKHAQLEESFNDKYRFAGNMLTLLLMNHFVSAFDAFFTVRLRNHRMEASMSSEYLGGFRLRYRF
jgi:hypothetical protein